MQCLVNTRPDAPGTFDWGKHAIPICLFHIGFGPIYRLQACVGVDGELIRTIPYDVAMLLV